MAKAERFKLSRATQEGLVGVLKEIKGLMTARNCVQILAIVDKRIEELKARRPCRGDHRHVWFDNELADSIHGIELVAEAMVLGHMRAKGYAENNEDWVWVGGSPNRECIGYWRQVIDEMRRHYCIDVPVPHGNA